MVLYGDLGAGNCTLWSGYCTLLADLNLSVLSAVNGYFNGSARIAGNIPAADAGAYPKWVRRMGNRILVVNGNIVLYGDLYISTFTSNRCIILTACRPDGRMALNGDLGIFCAIANGRAVEPGCYDIDIFILCGSPGRANGHLCLGVLSTVSGSANGGSISTGPIDTSTLCNDRCMVTDHNARCRATVIPPKGTAAADGSTIISRCRHLGMPLDGDIICTSGKTIVGSTTADACSDPAACCVNGCIALYDNVSCTFACTSSDACRTVCASTFCGQTAGGT